MHRRKWDTTLYGIAEDQSGYFTAAQAKAAGLHQVRLVQLSRWRSTLRRDPMTARLSCSMQIVGRLRSIAQSSNHFRASPGCSSRSSWSRWSHTSYSVEWNVSMAKRRVRVNPGSEPSNMRSVGVDVAFLFVPPKAISQDRNFVTKCWHRRLATPLNRGVIRPVPLPCIGGRMKGGIVVCRRAKTSSRLKC